MARPTTTDRGKLYSKREEKQYALDTNIRRKAVSSSNLRSVGYKNGVLEVAFKRSVYRYSDVPKSVHKELMQAGSHGRYHYYNIRYEFPYVRIG
jgi:hypothetical protein